MLWVYPRFMMATLSEAGPETNGRTSAKRDPRSGLLEDFLCRLVAASTVSAVTQAAVDATRDALSAEVSWSGIISGDFLTLAAYGGLRTAEMPALWRLQIGQGVGGRVAKEGRTIVTRDYRRDPRRVPVMKRIIDDEGIRSAVCAPVVAGSDVLGVLYAAHRSVRDWTPAEVRLVSDIARDTGVALARLRESHTTGLRAEEAETTARAANDSLDVVRAMATSLASTEDIGAGLDVLAQHLGMRIELLDIGGELVRDAPRNAHAAHRATGDEPVQQHVKVGEEPLGTIQIRGQRELTQSERDLTELCTHLITLQLLRERAALQTELRVHSEFLGDLLEGDLDDRHGILARAALLGVDLKKPRYVVCVGTRPPHTDGADPPKTTRRSFNQVERAVRQPFPGSVVVPRDGDMVVLLEPGSAEFNQVRQDLKNILSTSAGDSSTDLAAGIGRMCLNLDDYADSYAEAALALDLARRRYQAGEILTPADLGFYGLFARGSTRQSLESMVANALGPILDVDANKNTEYVKTLDAYLASDRHRERTASDLHVHPNTVRYRITQIQEMLGVSLRDVDNRFLLELALRARAALEDD